MAYFMYQFYLLCIFYVEMIKSNTSVNGKWPV